MEELTEKQGSGKGASLVAAVVVAVSVLAVVGFVLSQKRKFTPVVAGSPAMDFTLPNLEGREIRLSDYRGKVVFLNFWATWCKPCEDEIPSMEALYEALKGQPFEIVAVSVDKDGPEVVSQFAKKYGITFTVLHDPKGTVKDLYKTTGVPETFIIDPNGIIAEKVWGPRDWRRKESINTILELLQNGPGTKQSYRE
ncbi:MAG: TlpA family protein disulfide reductase [Deltaproteobacteria bacterium]|nr:TlpA family protein disulfide reductase [Deltaproteobacteria bacterium]